MEKMIIKRVRQVGARFVLFSICLILISVWLRLVVVSEFNQFVIIIGGIMGLLVVPLFLICFKFLVYVNNNELEFITLQCSRLIGLTLMLGSLSEDIYELNISLDTVLFVMLISGFMWVANKLFKSDFTALLCKELRRR